jgi:glyoxylase-like metal-dependent hydrolase (beta-lactamase superfamily II)
MVEEVFAHIFRMEIPLPGNPLKAINSYVIKGDGRFLMIDTGMNREECMAAMQAGVRELGVDLQRTDFFITHLHADHLGLVSELALPSSKIYFNHPDSLTIQESDHWQKMADVAMANGFPAEILQAAIQKHPGRRYHISRPLDFTLLREGDELPIGAYTLRCVETPGHSRGHLCLYEPRSKIFFSGDHILGGITPNISSFRERENPLQSYLESLTKVEGYEVALVLPGHRRLFPDLRTRVAELKEHHRERNEEILTILAEGPLNAYQVASRMSWDISYKTWEDFPIPQKWFAAGEALAHLQYLEGQDRIRAEREARVVLFGNKA